MGFFIWEKNNYCREIKLFILILLIYLLDTFFQIYMKLHSYNKPFCLHFCAPSKFVKLMSSSNFKCNYEKFTNHFYRIILQWFYNAFWRSFHYDKPPKDSFVRTHESLRLGKVLWPRCSRLFFRMWSIQVFLNFFLKQNYKL